ncbi:ABC transporter permease [Sphingobacteriaceae bacterium WQ 2009]|uniref:ABC transporter permease n=1 Tax=Rhinopithecimicrobium faecis TaxID=2820698 RepID=A0A8T4HB18_9SPHI|nr:ABC transporter permease [Sphingobacteriaceae bacterium WQ 2009]
MHKILLIIQREYVSRVKKKSFLLLTFLVPIFFIGMYAAMFYLMKKGYEDNFAEITVVDEQGSFYEQLRSNKNVAFLPATADFEAEKEKLRSSKKDFASLLYIPKDIYNTRSLNLISAGKSNLKTRDEISSQVQEIIRNKLYQDAGIDKNLLATIDPNVTVSAREISSDGEEKNANTEIAMGIGVALAILVYLSLFLYGVQVMRGVIEEKSNRIIEVIISSVKPFQLMMGKIIGIGMVGLTQFLLWILLTGGLFTVATTLFVDKESLESVAATQGEMSQGNEQLSTAVEKSAQMGGFLEAIKAVNFYEIAICFILFFLAGYLLYSAIFAAVGSAVDSETEANQFTMPVTMPLLITYILSFGLIINDPHGTISTWLSFIPFTSPIAMLVRIPFDVPLWQIATSLTLLILTFLGTTWVAARIYRVGILIYGKKPSFKELIKWFNYKS